MSDEDETFEIGFTEDGVVWITASSDVPDAAAAERSLGKGWCAVGEAFLRPTGQWANSKEEEWEHCDLGAPGARRGWRLVDTASPEIFEDGEWHRNPNHTHGR